MSSIMPLPVLQHHPQMRTEDLVRLFHRTELHLAEHLGQKVELDFGVAICNPELPDVPAANSMQDAFVPPGSSVAEVVAKVESHFAARNVRCNLWTLNPSVPPEQRNPLCQYLLDAGYETNIAAIYHLHRMSTNITKEVDDLKIIPARAGYRHVEQLAGPAAPEWMLRLDDPHWDALLALRHLQPVGYVGVLAVGDIGRIETLFVPEKFRRQGIGRILLNRAMDIATRSQFKHLFISTPQQNEPAQTLLQSVGFHSIGQFPRYQKNKK
jgi:ribosomal protein S18 acetylase RimI-like enzyme